MDRKTGALTPLSVPIFTAGSNPDSIAVDPTGRFVYVANFNSGNVSGYSIDSKTGILTPLSVPTLRAGSGSQSVAADPTGKFVYVVGSGNVSRPTGGSSRFHYVFRV
jgi:DNA-binding beta-propeller fold protein YncE